MSTTALWTAKNARWRERPTGYLGVYDYEYKPVATTLRLRARHVRWPRSVRWSVRASIRAGKRTYSVTVRNAPSRMRGAYAALCALEVLVGRSVKP